MGPCCVEGCEVTSEDTYYFEFPTSRILRRKWLDVIPIPGKLPLGTVVCSRHFSADDYENVRGKVRLKRKVVPSLLLEQMNHQPSSPKLLAKEPDIATSRETPTKVIDPCDSTTVSVPSPTEYDKMMEDVVDKPCGHSTGDTHRVSPAVTEICIARENGRSGYEIKLEDIPIPDPKEDIEDMITNYHIKNKVPNTALLPDVLPERDVVSVQNEIATLQPMNETIEIDDGNDAAPVFIEISVDKDASATGGSSQDCLMLLESVQVDVDPTLLLDQDFDNYHESEKALDKKKDDPISLLTSSDEDDVIIQEPHIDTVEVSDATDEDDVPLVKLVKKKPQKKKLIKKKRKLNAKQKENLEKNAWDNYDYYCMQCHFTTKDSVEYNTHVSEHSKVLQVCPICSYTSASKTMFVRHMRKHKEDKKYQCHLCDYRAKHNMSLNYHLQCHNSGIYKSVKKGFKCQKCGFRCNIKSTVVEHVRLCHLGLKLHSCDKCKYETKRRSDLRRHMIRKHKECEEDDEYMPEA